MSEESISNYDWITGSLKDLSKKLSLVHANSDNVLSILFVASNHQTFWQQYEKMLVSKSQKTCQFVCWKSNLQLKLDLFNLKQQLALVYAGHQYLV